LTLLCLARKAYLETGAEPPPDFVSRLLRAHKGEIGDSPLTMDEVRHTAIEVRDAVPLSALLMDSQMFIGATNSTPDMVCYVMLFLAEHGDVQEALFLSCLVCSNALCRKLRKRCARSRSKHRTWYTFLLYYHDC
jgi:hypothetical protein